eukprot:14426491-Heterocapsa_arctica.AAC.1
MPDGKGNKSRKIMTMTIGKHGRIRRRRGGEGEASTEGGEDEVEAQRRSRRRGGGYIIKTK